MSQLRFPDGQVVTIARTSPDFEFSAVLPPGHRGPPAHRHRFESESFTVHDGRLQVRLGRERRLVVPGETVVVPPGTTHSFSNPYDEPARISTIESPAGPLEAQLRALAANGGRPPLLRLAEINAAHSWSFTVAGLPDGPQRALWRLLARVAAVRR